MLQQSRNLSWWGSGASKTTSTPSPEATPSSNLNISEPSDLKSIISPDRSFKASSNVSSAELEAQASSHTHTPNSLEPQFIEDIQQAIAQPHFTDPEALPVNPEDVPERIGYLYEACGLDFGWGPTSTMQFLLEHLHITGGFSWTASIVLLGLAVRAVVFPFLITAAKQTQKMRDFNVVLQPIQAEYQAAKEKGDQKKMAQSAQRLISVKKEFGLQIRKAFYAPMLQIPLGFGCWRLLRNAADLPVPGFVTESWLWTTDLTFSDPYFIAPVTSAALIWLTMKILPFVTFFFMTLQPGAVQLYFVASSSVGLASAVILQRSSVRAFFGMPPLAPAASATSKIPIISGPNPAKPAPKPTNIVSQTTGGLHRRSIVDRKAEAERAARLPAEKTASGKEISPIDKFVNWGKRHVKDVRTAGGQIAKGVGLTEGTQARKLMEQEEQVEARTRETLERQRRERNSSMRR